MSQNKTTTDTPESAAWLRERIASMTSGNPGGEGGARPDDPPGKPTPTLAKQVEDLSCRFIRLDGLAGEMLATIKLNVKRGYLMATNDEGKLNLTKIVANWEKQLAEIQEV